MDDDGMDEKEEEDDDDDAGSVSASTLRFSPGDNVSMIASVEALINSSGVPPEAIMNQLGTNDMGTVAAVRSASREGGRRDGACEGHRQRRTQQIRPAGPRA